MNVYLKRISQSHQGTFGVLQDVNQDKLCMTLEPPPDVEHPCIPTGTYHCIPHDSPAHPNTWELQNVPSRSAILIHSGNFIKDTLGCILVGTQKGNIDGKPAITESMKALSHLRGTLPSEFDITITEHFI